MTGNKQLFGAIQAASYNIVLQVFFRLQTFLLNGFILRYISKDVLGIINVRLFLYYSTVLFLSKECFRNTCLSKTDEHNWPKVINLLWLTVPVAAICSSVFGFVWIYLLELPEDVYVSQYKWAIVVIGACCVLEMVAEPLHIVARIFLFNKIRVIAESTSVAVRCVCLAFVSYWNPDVAIGGFVVGQVLYSILWVGIYYLWLLYVLQSQATNQLLTFPFKRIPDIFPRVLDTVGERYVMTMFSVLSFAEQGIFDVVSNLGSIAARFIFRPVEDSSFQFFSSMVKRGIPLKKHKNKDTELVANVLQNLFRAMVLLGMIVLAFGFSYSRLLLQLYGGAMLSSSIGTTLLRWHCVYILFLAVNGISECYVLSTMSKTDVDRYNFKMVFFSIGFLFLSWFLTRLVGSVGFILANCANMLARITFSCNYIHNVYNQVAYRPLQGLLPHSMVIAAIMASAIITSQSEAYLCCDHGTLLILIHIGVGAVCLFLVVAVIFFKEQELMKLGQRLFHKKDV